MLSSTVVVLAVVLGQGEMTSTPEEFQEFGSLVVGRWSGDITLIADWPGMKKKAGEKLINYMTVQWVADGKSFIATTVGGETTNFSLWFYDPIAKQIQVSTPDSAGGTLHAVIWKVSRGKWGFKVTGGGLADGRKSGGEGHILFEDDGNTQILEGDMTLGGAPLPKLRDVYTRLAK